MLELPQKGLKIREIIAVRCARIRQLPKKVMMMQDISCLNLFPTV